MTESRPRAAARREPGGYAPSVAERLAFYQRAGGIITPIFTVLLAFFAGGLVVLATGHNPLRTYKAIWDGTGLNWFFEFGHHHIDIPFTHHQVFFWWNTDTNGLASYNLTQTLILTTTLDLHGPRGRVRVPLRALQHRRPGPVHHRRDRLGLGRLVVGRDDAGPARLPRDRARDGRRRRASRRSPAS